MSENQFGNPGNGHQGDMPYCWMGKMIITIEVTTSVDSQHESASNVENTSILCVRPAIERWRYTVAPSSLVHWQGAYK